MFDVTKDLERRLAKNLEEAAQHFEVALKAKLNTSHQSEPGEAPGKDTGSLQDSITHVVDGDTAYIGSDDSSALPLEFGTSKMAARPFIRPTLQEEAEAIAKIMAK
jgi:HK97 gp10 family phage protein